MPHEKQRVFAAKVEEVFSGDDLIVMVDLGFDQLFKRKRFRLDNVDTPNAVHLPYDTVAGNIRSHVKTLIMGKQVEITVTKFGEHSWVGVVKVEQESGMLNVNDHLIEMGFKFNREKVSQ